MALLLWACAACPWGVRKQAGCGRAQALGRAWAVGHGASCVGCGSELWVGINFRHCGQKHPGSSVDRKWGLLCYFPFSRGVSCGKWGEAWSRAPRGRQALEKAAGLGLVQTQPGAVRPRQACGEADFRQSCPWPGRCSQPVGTVPRSMSRGRDPWGHLSSMRNSHRWGPEGSCQDRCGWAPGGRHSVCRSCV